jgi:hypothetical protein
MNDFAGACPLHGLSSSLPLLDAHTDLRTCDLISVPFYRGHYRKTIRKSINKPTSCSSCGGCKRFDHPTWACDNDSLQDFWLGIPYLVFTIPAITNIVFNSLGVYNTDDITESIETFGSWLYAPSTNPPIISSAYTQLYDLIHAFFESASQLSTIDWAAALKEANSRLKTLQPHPGPRQQL